MGEVMSDLLGNDLVVFAIGYAFGYFVGRTWKWGLGGGIGAVIFSGTIRSLMPAIGG